MEEGPEPQEWVERAAEEHHHGHTAAADHSFTALGAITAAILAVLASLGSLLSGHAANEAVLAMIRATDQWANFQSLSTKGHLHEVGAQIITALGRGPAAGATAEVSGSGAKPVEAGAVESFRTEAKRYEAEKAKLKLEAEATQVESRHELHRHHRFALAVAAFQVGIVLASVSLLVRLKPIYALSLVAGAAGMVCLILGLAA